MTYFLESLTIIHFDKKIKPIGKAFIPFYNKVLLADLAGYKFLGVLRSGCSFITLFLGIYCFVTFTLKLFVFIPHLFFFHCRICLRSFYFSKIV